MGLFDQLAGILGGGQQLSLSQLGTVWKWVQEQGGPQALLEKLQRNGLAEVVASWLGNGANRQVSAGEVHAALGEESLLSLATRLGIDVQHAAGLLAQMLPQVIDKLSPRGQLDLQPGSGLLKGFL